VRLDLFLPEYLAHRALDHVAETSVSCRPRVPAAASSTTRADSHDPWPCRTPETPAKP
jgi:hypothetical protein